MALSQAWLQVIGLFLDMAGVLLIAGEWLIAQRQERSILDIEQRRDVQTDQLARHRQMGPQTNPRMTRHLEQVAELARQNAGRAVEHARTRFGGVRTRVVLAGLALVVAGFVGQLLGAWPGCCPVLGIVPGSG